MPTGGPHRDESTIFIAAILVSAVRAAGQSAGHLIQGRRCHPVHERLLGNLTGGNTASNFPSLASAAFIRRGDHDGYI